jgi:cytochrome d ubiquinol oxidase subunit II
MLSILAVIMTDNYPNLLCSTLDPKFIITAENAAVSSYGLPIGPAWWLVGIVLAVAYFVYLFRLFRGKIEPPAVGYGY